jgi:hypothetical protein
MLAKIARGGGDRGDIWRSRDMRLTVPRKLTIAFSAANKVQWQCSVEKHIFMIHTDAASKFMV